MDTTEDLKASLKLLLEVTEHGTNAGPIYAARSAAYASLLRAEQARAEEPEKIVRVGVAVIIRNPEGRILFGLRKGAHGPGTWSLPGGHLDFGEEPEDTARREVMEETGLTVKEVRVWEQCPYVNSHFRQTGKQYITLYFEARYTGGEPVVMEPDKCERWEWCHPLVPPSPLFEPIELQRLRLGGR